MTHAQCWSHCRRAFEKAQESDPAAVAEALELIGTLYLHEEIIRGKGLRVRINWRTGCSTANPSSTPSGLGVTGNALDVSAGPLEASSRVLLG